MLCEILIGPAPPPNQCSASRWAISKWLAPLLRPPPLVHLLSELSQPGPARSELAPAG